MLKIAPNRMLAVLNVKFIHIALGIVLRNSLFPVIFIDTIISTEHLQT